MTGESNAKSGGGGGVSVLETHDFTAQGGNHIVTYTPPAGTKFALIDFIYGPTYSGHSFTRPGDEFDLTTMVEGNPSEAGHVYMSASLFQIQGVGMEYTTRGTVNFYG